MEVIACFRTDTQAVSISEQTLLQTFADDNGLTIGRCIPIDQLHVAGEDLWARKWLRQTLLHSLRTRRAGVLLADWFALAATPAEIALLRLQLEGLGLRVIAVTDAPPKVSKSIEGALALGAAAGTSFEKARIAATLQIGRRSALGRNDRCGGNPRYGQRPGEKKTLDRIVELRTREKLSDSAIAKRLNEEGVKPRSAKVWNPSTIASLLGKRREKEKRSKAMAVPPSPAKG